MSPISKHSGLSLADGVPFQNYHFHPIIVIGLRKFSRCISVLCFFHLAQQLFDVTRGHDTTLNALSRICHAHITVARAIARIFNHREAYSRFEL